jgi:hypothetical protein
MTVVLMVPPVLFALTSTPSIGPSSADVMSPLSATGSLSATSAGGVVATTLVTAIRRARRSIPCLIVDLLEGLLARTRWMWRQE